MRIVFSPAFDGGAWPGPLRGGNAALSEAWLGAPGMLDALETRLGLGGLSTPPSERVARTARTARDASSTFYAASMAVDPIGCARRLVEARDELVMAGLDPDGDLKALPARARELLEAMALTPPGSADRLWRVARTLAAAPGVHLDIAQVAVDDEASLPPLWRTVLERLAAAGVKVGPLLVEHATPAGDLGAVRSAPFAPALDGSLLLLRAESADVAADEVGAAVARAAATAEVLVIGADSTLDNGLARRGAPTCGAAGDDGDDELLQVLPLVLALAQGARDPGRVLELLSLSRGPVPRGVSLRLLRALSRAPSTHGAAFAAALEEGLAALPEAARDATRVRILELLREEDDVGAASVSALRRRIRVVQRWAAARARGPEEAAFAAVVAQGSLLLRMVEELLGSDALADARTLPWEQLGRLVDEASRRAPRRAQHRALAGLQTVADPAAVVGPAQLVVWWNFTRGSAEVPRPALAWSARERAALRQLQVHIDEPGQRARRHAAAQARPLMAATEQLVLVCPQLDRAGQEQHPHPLWDEIVGRTTGGAAGALHLEVPRWRGPRAPVRVTTTALPPLMARAHWPVPAPVVRALESPSSMERLLGCPMHFVLETWGVKQRTVVRLDDGNKLFGIVAHEVLARVLRERHRDPAHAARSARAHTQDVMRERADAWLLPREVLLRRSAEETIATAASGLVAELQAHDMEVKHVEEEFAIERNGRRMAGTPDLVVQQIKHGKTSLAIIDVKTGSERLHEEKLAFDTAVQLAYYSYLVHQVSRAGDDDGDWPAVAYYQVKTARLMSTDARHFHNSEPIPGAGPKETLRQVRAQATRRFDEIAAGSAHAPGAIDDPEPLDDGIAPPCRFCEHDLLCGRALREGRRR